MPDKKPGFGNLPHPASPGLSGAISDAVESVKRFMGTPRQRRFGVEGQTEDQIVSGKHDNQHTDRYQ